MRPIYLFVTVGAYLGVLIQLGAFGAWPLLGGQPHLIALGAVVFLVGGRLDLGIVWMLVGGALYDLLLPVHFGITLVPLFVTYGLLQLVLARFFDAPSWLGTLVLGLGLLLGTELPLMMVLGSWSQLPYDLLAGALILIPLAWVLIRRLELRRQGLTVR